MRIRVRLRPRYDWGKLAPQITQGSHHIRYVGPDQTLRLNTDASLNYVLSETYFVLGRHRQLPAGPG